MRHAEALNAEKLAFLTDIEGVFVRSNGQVNFVFRDGY